MIIIMRISLLKKFLWYGTELELYCVCYVNSGELVERPRPDSSEVALLTADSLSVRLPQSTHRATSLLPRGLLGSR